MGNSYSNKYPSVTMPFELPQVLFLQAHHGRTAYPLSLGLVPYSGAEHVVIISMHLEGGWVEGGGQTTSPKSRPPPAALRYPAMKQQHRHQILLILCTDLVVRAEEDLVPAVGA